MEDGTTHRRNLPAREVVAWRRERLAAAGFAAGLAGTLAHEPRMDLHALIELTERGCPPETAARILAPLDTAPGELVTTFAASLGA
ncbi:MAG: hypothetical protein ACAH79_11765 [Thermoleophilia bacterium]